MSGNSNGSGPGAVCHLFRLSGELRNLIYEYVLSEDTILHYHHGTNSGRGSILARVPNINAPEYGGLYGGTTTGKTSNDAIPEGSKPVKWSLAKELDKVYYRYDANQLKFVNRQLYMETRGLVLRYNQLEFGLIVDFAEFLKCCPKHHYAHFRVLEVNHSIFLPDYVYNAGVPEAVEYVLEFCRRNPHVLVRDRLMDSVESIWFVVHFARLQLYWRRSTQLLDKVLNNSPARPVVLVVWREDNDMPSRPKIPGNLPENFRLCVKEKEVSETALQVWREACLASPRARRILSYVEGGIDVWVQAAREIIQSGI
ncbi:hypothetical protein N0V83_001053 [Neocucurbitaria cava]|uniref:Uncharacterized protein n=1 Tax=Neocucurbitaria cava TaxID=798079 RepID=A0A9W8YE67_9PLEO|nr:hypothetical protein N0V83_001053 [Neocucurbitaria cava]